MTWLNTARAFLAKRYKVILFVALLIIFIGLSIPNAKRQRVGTDFHVFWLAGKNFAGGAPLYVTPEGVRDYVYPPFAAMLFQVFALLPLQPAGGLFYFANLALFVFSIILVKRIFERLYPCKKHLGLLAFFAGLLSGRFFLNNLNLLQINSAVSFLLLLAVYAHISGKYRLTGPLIVVATFIKVVPAFFLGRLVLRGNRREAVPVVIAILVCLALPLAFRGFDRGALDLVEYSETFLKPFLDGKVVTTYTNQNLAATIHRMGRPPETSHDLDYRYMSFSPETAKRIWQVSAAAVMLALTGSLLLLRKKRRPVNAFEISCVFLASHLLAGITWKAHLVSLIFVYMAFFCADYGAFGRAYRFVKVFVIALVISTPFAGSMFVGKSIHMTLGGYSTVAWTLVLFYVLTTWLAVDGARHPEADLRQ
jgi:hypothetical protein